MLGFIKMENLITKENIFGRMDQFMQVILLKERGKDSENGDQVQQMEISIKDNIKKTKNQEKENIFGQKVANSKGNFSLT